MKKAYLGFSVVLLSLAFAGCGIAPKQDEARAVVYKHYKYISQEQYQLAIDQYSPYFYEQTSKAKWKKTLAVLTKKLGDLNRYDIVGFQFNTGTTAFGTGTIMSFQCKVNYSKYDADERISLFQGTNDKDYQIVGHNINSNGLLAE